MTYNEDCNYSKGKIPCGHAHKKCMNCKYNPTTYRNMYHRYCKFVEAERYFDKWEIEDTFKEFVACFKLDPKDNPFIKTLEDEIESSCKPEGKYGYYDFAREKEIKTLITDIKMTSFMETNYK